MGDLSPGSLVLHCDPNLDSMIKKRTKLSPRIVREPPSSETYIGVAGVMDTSSTREV